MDEVIDPANGVATCTLGTCGVNCNKCGNTCCASGQACPNGYCCISPGSSTCTNNADCCIETIKALGHQWYWSYE